MPHHLTVAWHDCTAARLLRQGVDCTGARLSTYRPGGLGQQHKYQERVVRALSLVLHTVSVPVSRCARFRDQLQGPATKMARMALRKALVLQNGTKRYLGGRPRRSLQIFSRRFASFQRQRSALSSWSLDNYVFRANGPFTVEARGQAARGREQKRQRGGHTAL